MNLEKFRAAVRGSDVVFVVGTGVSAATTGGEATATWVGLLRDGVERIQSIGGESKERWSELVEGLLEYGLDSGVTMNLIQAASMVASEMKLIGEKEYARWLEESVGSLPMKDESTAKALLSYPFPILTTNYDTLLESVGKRASAVWTDPGPFQKVLTRESDAIGHLHGVWNAPESVVLSDADYTRLLSHSSTIALERAMSTLKSIVYVGFGAGLEDPNFSSLLKWHRDTFTASGVTHFRLCRTEEEAVITRTHGNDNVVAVSYGNSHSDLAPFLRKEAPARSSLAINDAGLARDVVQEARNDLKDSMAAESVLLEAKPGADRLPELIVPPILLPLPYSMYVRERMMSSSDVAMEPYDAQEEVRSQDLMIVVGDEGTGVSTAVKWLAVEASRNLGSAAPLFVPFTQCVGRRPLVSGATRAALTLGLINDKRALLPPHVLALDDFDLSTKSVGHAALDEFIESNAIVKVLGCKQGSEDGVISRLRDAGLNPRVYHLGRLRDTDVRALANIVSPGEGNRIAAEVSRVLRVEGLHRTPLTVSILIYLVYRGVSETGSQTSIIDSYVQLLLTFGDPHLPRPSLSEQDLIAVLSNLAGYMTWEERSSIPETEAVSAIAAVISKYDWPAQATEILSYLCARRILRIRSGHVEFLRTSYFFVFAARRAVVDKDFRELLVNDAFYYEPVITRYAALAKTDGDLLDYLSPVIDEALSESVETLTPYEIVPLIEIEGLSDSPVTDAVDEWEDDLTDNSSVDAESEPKARDELELPEYNGNVGFGLVKAEMSIAARMHRSVRMASIVLRDLDQIENIETKQSLLLRVLEVWGRYLTALNSDAKVKNFNETLRRHLETVEPDEERREKSYVYLANLFPAASALGAISNNLVTVKLLPTFDRALEAGTLTATEERRTAAIFFLLALKPAEWAKRVLALVEGAAATWVVANFVHDHCWSSYVTIREPESTLLRVCIELDSLGKMFANDRVRGAHQMRYEQKLKAYRSKYRAQNGL